MDKNLFETTLMTIVTHMPSNINYREREREVFVGGFGCET